MGLVNVATSVAVMATTRVSVRRRAREKEKGTAREKTKVRERDSGRMEVGHMGRRRRVRPKVVGVKVSEVGVKEKVSPAAVARASAEEARAAQLQETGASYVEVHIMREIARKVQQQVQAQVQAQCALYAV